MTKPRYALKRDDSEQSIVTALRACGVSVSLADTPVDAWLGFKGKTWPAEFKTPNTQYGKKLNQNQQDFSDGWNGSPILIFRDSLEAIDWANEQRKS